MADPRYARTPAVTPADLEKAAARRVAALRAAAKTEEDRKGLLWKAHLAEREGNSSLSANLRRRARAL